MSGLEFYVYLVAGIGIPALLILSIAIREWVSNHYHPHHHRHA